MIEIRRSPPPAELLSEVVSEAQAKIRDIVDNGEKPKSTDFAPHWGKKGVREALWEMQHHKCCYCERIRDVNRESDVEHFRPKAGVTGADGHLGYWWLAYEWTNLFFSCRHCNQEYKKNHFPVRNEDDRVHHPRQNLEDEEAFLVNPEDDPESCICYDCVEVEGDEERRYIVFPRGRDSDGRGAMTIKTLGLDRDELILLRARLIPVLNAIVTMMNAGKHFDKEGLIQRASDLIRKETSAKQNFAGFRRWFFQQAQLGEYVAND